MNTLAFCGYDFRNIGDDAFMNVFAKHILDGNFFSHVSVTSSYLPNMEDTTQITPIYANMTAKRGAHLYRLLQNSWPIHLFAVVGGSVLHDTCHFEREYWKLRLLKTLNPKMKVVAVGVSVGPISTRESLSRLEKYLRLFDYISVRDEPSLTILEQLKLSCPVRKHFDLAALLDWQPKAEHISKKEIEPAPTTLGIAPCHVHRYRAGNPDLDTVRCDQIAKAINLVANQQDIKIKFFQCNGHSAQGDLPAIQQIKERLSKQIPVEVVRYSPNPSYFLEEVARCDAFVAMRLHAAIFAFLTKTPITSLSYHPKCEGFAQEIGLTSSRQVNANAFTPDELSLAIQNTLAEKENGSLTVEEAKESARQHFIDLFSLWPSQKKAYSQNTFIKNAA